MSNHEEKAFPSTVQYFPEDTNYHLQQGMTLRDYFAAKVMASYLIPAGETNTWAQRHEFPYIAETAYAMADAMLKVRDD